MSSVSASDRSSRTDDVRRAREEYENREVENAKRHKKELNRVSSSKNEEVEKLKEDYDRQIDQLRNKQRELLSRRDEENQKNIEKIKSLYIDQLKRKSEDQSLYREASQEAHANEIAKLKSTSEIQREELKKDFDGSLQERDQNLETYSKKSREQMRESIEERTKRLNEAHEKELSVVKDYQDRQLGDTRRQLESARKTYKDESVRERNKYDSDLERLEGGWKTELESKDERLQSTLSENNQAMKEERDWQRRQYSDRVEKKMAELDGLNENLRESVIDRANRQLNSAHFQLAKEKNARVMDNLSATRLNKLELKHRERDHQDAIKNLELERGEILNAANQEASNKISDFKYENEKLMAQVNRRHTSDRDMQKAIYDQDRAQLIQQAEGRTQWVEGNADERVQKIVKASNKSQQELQRVHEDSIEQLKENYAQKLAKLREQQTEQIKVSTMSLQKRLQESQLASSKKIEDTTSYYEEKLDSLQADFRKEIDRLNRLNEQRLVEQEKAAKLDQETLATKYEDKLGGVQIAHRKELERQEQRHQEQLASVVSRVEANRKV